MTIENEKTFSVTEISTILKKEIEKMAKIRIEGEITGFKKHGSGHCYFALKDEGAVLDAVMWRGSATKITFPITEGLNVICTGGLTTFPGRSKYQMIAENIQPKGEGLLSAAFEALKRALAEEGLFSAERKKALPFLCINVALITSPTGAVVQDILHRFRDRLNPNVTLYPVKVQGDGAETEIARAIEFFESLDQKTAQALGVSLPDIIIIARGGGSKEDLQPFNTEIIVRAVAKAKLPIISAVGHETDVTLIDFAADMRAPTPTAAAEFATKVKSELLAYLAELHARATQAVTVLLQRRKENLSFHGKIFLKAPDALLQKLQQADLLFSVFADKFSAYFLQQNHRLALLANLFQPDLIGRNLIRNRQRFLLLQKQFRHSLEIYLHQQERKISGDRERLSLLSEATQRNLLHFIRNQRVNLDNFGSLLETLSYKSALARGYAVIRAQGAVLSGSQALIDAKDFDIELKDGITRATVK